MERRKHIVQSNILVGAWLIIAPFVLGYSGATVALENNLIIGIVLMACSLWILADFPAPGACSILQLFAGLWLIATPFYFHYARAAHVYTNDVLAGALAAIVGGTTTWMIFTRTRRPA